MVSGISAVPIAPLVAKYLFLSLAVLFVMGYVLLQIVAFRRATSIFLHLFACTAVIGVWGINSLIQLATTGYSGVYSNVFLSLSVVIAIVSTIHSRYRYWGSIITSVLLVVGFAISISGTLSVLLGVAPYAFILANIVIILVYLSIEYHREVGLHRFYTGITLLVLALSFSTLLVYYGTSTGSWTDVGYLLIASTLLIPITFILDRFSYNTTLLLGILMLLFGFYTIVSTFLGMLESIVAVWIMLILVYFSLTKEYKNVIYPFIIFTLALALLVPIEYNDTTSIVNAPIRDIISSHEPMLFEGSYGINASIEFNKIYATVDSVTFEINANLSAGRNILSLNKAVIIKRSGETNMPLYDILFKFPDLYHVSIDADSRFVGTMLATYDASSIIQGVVPKNAAGLLSLEIRKVSNAVYVVAVFIVIFVATLLLINYRGSREW